MRMKAGLIGRAPAWEPLLSQEGFPWVRMRRPEELDLATFSVVIGEPPDERMEDALKAYVEAGGAAIVPQRLLARWSHLAWRWERYRYLTPRAGSALRWNRLIDLPGRGLSIDGHGELVTDRGKAVLPIIPLGKGYAAALPVGPGRYIDDVRARRICFYSPVRPFPTERVSRIPRGELRLMFRSALEALHHRRGLWYGHLRFFPDDRTGVFGLRIDTDYAGRDDVEHLYAFLEEFRIPATWFLHVKAHIGWIRDLAKMEGQEIGVHCYAHEPYGRGGLDRREIAKARHLLEGSGISPIGFAAPYGIWREELPGDLEAEGFLYSSEFGYDYDNLPAYPWVRGGYSSVLHIPIHPVAVGTLRRTGYGGADMIPYFASVLERKQAVREPLFFYHHPGDGHLEILRNLIGRVDREAYPMLTFSEYCRWWQERDQLLRSIEISDRGDEIEAEGEKGTERHLVDVTAPDGKWSCVPLGRKVDLDRLDWHEAPEPPALLAGIEAIRNARVRRFLDDCRAYLWRRK